MLPLGARKGAIHELPVLLLRAGDDGAEASRHLEVGRGKTESGAGERGRARVPEEAIDSRRQKLEWRFHFSRLQPSLLSPGALFCLFSIKTRRTGAACSIDDARASGEDKGEGSERRERAAAADNFWRAFLFRRLDASLPDRRKIDLCSPRFRVTRAFVGLNSRHAAIATVSSGPRAREEGERRCFTRTLAKLFFSLRLEKGKKREVFKK